MLKRPFLFFVLIVGFWISALLWFIQSPQFAIVLKGMASRYIPKGIGIRADFSELSVKLFPPGFSVKNPVIKVEKENIAKLPPGSEVKAERIDFVFLPLQIFSGDIRVHEVAVVNGSINVKMSLALDQNGFKKKPDAEPHHRFSFHWDELFQVHVESVALQNIHFSVSLNDEHFETTVKDFKLAQWSGHGGLGYLMRLSMEDFKSAALKQAYQAESIRKIEAEGRLNALGFQLDRLEVTDPRIRVLLSGLVHGNLLTAKSLKAEAKGEIEGDLAAFEPILQKAGLRKKEDIPLGHVSLQAKAEGDLFKLMDTLRVDATLKAQNFAFKSWKADSILVEGRWDAAPTGGEVTLNRAYFLAKEVDRVGNRQPGSGGGIEVRSVKWKIGSSAPIQIPVHLERAHIHWLGAPAIQDLYGLDFRLNGGMDLTVFPPTSSSIGERPLEIQGKLQASLSRFRLDNQKYLESKPLSTVFDIPKIDIEGGFSVDAKSLRVQNMVVSLPRTHLKANGKIDFKSGYDLNAVGVSNLEDIGKIAGNAIFGEGNLNVHVHGPITRVVVDVDTDIQSGSYLNLALGDIRGRITWDDKPQFLIFDHMEATKGFTSYTANGKLVLGKNDQVDMDVQIPGGNIQDFIQIFDFLVRPLSWFPYSLSGPFSGSLKVEGGIQLDRLKVMGDFEGSNWEFHGERFKTFKISGGYDGGSYVVNHFSALKRTGKVQGRVGYFTGKRWDWDLSSTSFNLSDIDHIARLDVPVRGKLEMRSVGKGEEGVLDSSTVVDLTDFSVRGVSMAPSHLSVNTERGVVTVHGSAIEGQGVLDVSYDSNPTALSSIQASLKQLDFSPILLFFNPKSIQDKDLAGTCSGDLNLSFHAGSIERANGSFKILNYFLAHADSQFTLVHPVVSKITDGTFEVNDLAVRGKRGDAKLDLISKQGELQGRVSGDLDLSLLEFLISAVNQAEGVADLDFLLRGTIKNPQFSGEANVKMDTLRLASFESPIENISANLRFHQNLLSVQRFEGELGGGSLTVGGALTLYPDRFPSIGLNAKLNNSKIKVYPFQYAKVSGTLGVHGEEAPYTVDGKLFLLSALAKEKVLNQKQTASGLKALTYAPPPKKQNETNASKFKLNIDIDAPSGILIQNDLFRDAQAKGHLTIVNTLETPRILGNAELIQGKLLFKDHVFQIQTAAASFDNPNVVNPRFDLNANTEINNVKIQLFVTGRLDKMKVDLSSTPAMSESDILSLLTFGMTSGDAKKLNSTDLSAVQQGEAASLVLHSLDFNRDLEDKTGFQVQVDESTNTQQGVSAFRPVSQSDSSAAPQITIRRKLGDRISLSAGRTVGAGSLQMNQANLDYSVNSNLSLTGVFNNYGTNGSADAQTNQNSFGLDLKFQKRFK